MYSYVFKSTKGLLYGFTYSTSFVLLSGAMYDLIDRKFYYNRYRDYVNYHNLRNQIIIPGLLGMTLGFLYGFTDRSIIENTGILIKYIKNKN